MGPMECWEMKMSMRFVCATAALALLGVLCPTTQADDRKAPPSPEALLTAIAEAGKPGAEHKKLEPLVGQWSFTMKFWTDPSLPPAQMEGTVERKWIMDGRFVQESLQGHCTKTGKEFEGLGLWGYNAAEKQFTNSRACSLFGTLAGSALSCDSTGRSEERRAG